MRKILSIDGGGAKGVIPITLLKYLDKKIDKGDGVDKFKMSKTFDLFAGTSTGGIIALLLAMENKSLDEILSLYMGETGKKIFKGRFSLNPLNAVKYPSENIESVLSEIMGDTVLGELNKNILIPSYDMSSRQAVVFTNTSNEYKDMPIASVARATSAAPTFFEPYKCRGNLYIDGGMFSNNPALSAYVEAKKLYPDEGILLISLGTGTQYQQEDIDKVRKYNVLDWAKNLFDITSDGQSDNTEYLLRKLLPEDRYFRFQVRLPKTNASMDNIKESNLKDLVNLTNNYINDQWKSDLERLLKVIN